MFYDGKLVIFVGLLSATVALGFENLPIGSLTDGKMPQGRIMAKSGDVEVMDTRARTGTKVLRLLEGKKKLDL